MKKKLGGIFLIVFVLVIGFVVFQKYRNVTPQREGEIVSNLDGEVVDMIAEDLKKLEDSFLYEVAVSNLEIPWEIVFLPTGEMLVTERPGRLVKIGQENQVIEIDGVRHIGEGGLLGLALHPDFENNSWLYLYLTSDNGIGFVNRVERYDLVGDSLENKQVIIDKIPGARYHDGGRIAFGSDGYLYITTGDAGNASNAQDIEILAGKILRVDENGQIPFDNPFENEVYSYGHRNPQGLAWDDDGRLWATEHGRSGVASGLDELNLIEIEKNYGWPEIEGDESQEDMASPVIHSGADVTWAPAGLALLDGYLYFCGLRGSSLYRVRINADASVGELEKFFDSQFGRLRAISVGPDGYLYVSTSNRDGRGSAQENDDKIIKINPALLK